MIMVKNKKNTKQVEKASNNEKEREKDKANNNRGK